MMFYRVDDGMPITIVLSWMMESSIYVKVVNYYYLRNMEYE